MAVSNGSFRSRLVTTAVVSIPQGENLSDAAAIGSARLVGVQMPPAWTESAISFSGSMDGGVVFQDIYDDASERQLAATAAVAGRTVALDPLDWAAFTHIKLRSGLSGAPTPQAAARTILLALESGG